MIHLDISPENLGNMYRTSVSLCGDAKVSLEFMLKTAKENNLKRSHELDNFTQERDRTRNDLLNMKMPDINKGIFPPYFVKVLNEILPENSIITTEAGVCSIYTTPLLNTLAPGRRYLSNYSLGALGYAIPAAWVLLLLMRVRRFWLWEEMGALGLLVVNWKHFPEPVKYHYRSVSK